MATANPAKTLQDDATCSICLDYFQDPVMIIECGHNFCRACITKYWKASDCSACCPECRQLFSWKNLKPNRQLGNMVETAKQLNLQLKNSSEKERMCEEHQKPLTVFCKTDQTLICTVCDRSKAHRNHEVVHTPEASAHYKEMLLRHLENLKKERNKIQSAKSNGEKPCQELLNIGSVLDRCKKGTFQYPAIPDASDMKKRFYQFCEGSTFLQSSLRKFRDNLLKPKWIKENVLFDPETAHPRYVVSADRKTVRWGSIRQEFPYNPKRFHYVRCVLGCKGFTSGKHYWTVDVGDGDYWAVGVARESVEREEEIEFEPDEGIWALGLYNDQYKALTSPPTLLDVEDEPTQIQISLNYEAGTVAFYDTEDNTRLFTFQSVDFEGEEIFPFFRIVDSSTVLKLCS
ncbi:zinc finger protein RFP-like isoform X2 [Eublepharis macularius]|uniref:Zinc finger protein RFP-like isoform X2 n=1 Tax=Eublepharis macularius TaxID=481883 RepID=A0AA97JC84_EUBMA|nr:zinc finger protein RFP-like isoform X2 [Eublepharis macularius]